MHDTLYELVRSYGYLIVFLLVGIESFGIPLPGETALITASALAAMGRLEIFGVIAAAAGGAILGDNAGYWVGKKGGLPLIHRYGKYVRLDETKVERMHAFFEKHGSKTVFLGRFVSLLRSWAAALAGVARMPYGTFMFWNALGGVTWAGIFGSLGYAFGRKLPLLERYIGQASLAAALLAALVVTLAVGARWFSANRATLSARLSERWRMAATDPRLAGFRSHHQRLWAVVASQFARGEYLLIHLALGLVVSVAALWIIGDVTEDIIHHDPLTRFDLALAAWMHRHESPLAYGIFHYVSLAGSPPVMAVVALIVSAALVVRREWIILSGWLAAFLGGSFLGRVLEAIVTRPRSQGGAAFLTGSGLSFPTGHALGSLVGYGLLSYLLVGFVVRRRDAQTAIVVFAAALILAIAFSRLYLGALYFSDIVTMYAGGAVWLTACVTGIEIARRQPRPTLSEIGLDRPIGLTTPG
jgi:membrane protein DedA with SNARE-associated domain/membrane-associated phospholipid phosphatase